MPGRHALAVCLFISLLYFGDGFFGSRCLIPSGFLYQGEPWKSEYPQYREEKREHFDLLFQFYPWAEFFKKTIRSGQFPLWNPYNYLGTPFFANPQTALLFPLSWVHLLLPLRHSFTLIFILKLALVLSGMYLFLRSSGLTTEAGLAGAMIAGLSIQTVISLPYAYSNATLLFPWTLMAVQRLEARTSKANMLLLTGILALHIVGGQPQSALVAFLFTVVFFAVRAGFVSGFKLKTAALVLLSFFAAALVTAVQWMPSFEYYWDSLVAEGPRVAGSGIPYAPRNLMNFLAPDFFGSHRTQSYWGFPGYNDTAFYASVIALLLAPFAFHSPDSLTPEKRGLRLFSAIAGASALLLMLGAPGLENLLDLPGLSLVARNKFVFVLVFSLAVLAALGGEAFFSNPHWRPRGWLYATGGILAAAGIATLRYFWPYVSALHLQTPTLHSCGRAAACLALAIFILGSSVASARLLVPLLFLDLLLASYPVNARGNAAALYPSSPTLQKLTGKRISSLDGMLPPNASMVYQIQDFRGYDVMTPRRLFFFLRELDPEFVNVYDWFQKLDRLGIHAESLMVKDMDRAVKNYGESLEHYMKTRGNYYLPSISRINREHFFDLLRLDGVLSMSTPTSAGFVAKGPFVHLNPRARKVSFYTVWVVATEKTALQQLKRGSAGQGPVVEFDLPSPATGVTNVPASVQEKHRDTERQIYEVKSDHAGVFVQYERFYGGWRAYVDGREQPIFPADYLFRGIFIPAAGSHTIEFRYEPASFRIGGVISSLSVMFISLLAAVYWLLAKPENV